VENSVKAGLEQSYFSTKDTSPPPPVTITCARACVKFKARFYVNPPSVKVLVITMALSFGIHDYIEGAVITAVILLNIVVG
jgi:magnesium-transporting ATPase (P-type)